jgi:hypothetical protein
LSSICDKNKQHTSSPWTPTEHRFPSPHFLDGKLPINATLKFDDTALYICTSGSIVSEDRFAIEIYICRLAKKNTPHKKEKLSTYYSIKTSNTQGWKLAGAQLPKAPKNLAGLPEIEVYFSYLD